MKTKKLPFYVFVLFIVLISSQVMCNLPMNEEESLQVAEEILGFEIGEGLDYAVQVKPFEIQPSEKCEQYAKPQQNTIERFEFGKNGNLDMLTIISSNGSISYTKGAQDKDLFCRDVAPSGLECIKFIDAMAYELELKIYTDDRRTQLENCYLETHYLTLNEADNAQPVNNEPPNTAGEKITLTVDQCNCGGISIPLDASTSRASNNAFITSLRQGGQVELNGSLTCSWQADYQSESKTALMSISLTLDRFDEPHYAQNMFTEYKNEFSDQPQYCRAEGDSCRVAAEEFGETRAYYAWNSIYTRNRPSSSGANIARLINGKDGYYALKILASHPELPIDGTWAHDQALAAEACMLALVEGN